VDGGGAGDGGGTPPQKPHVDAHFSATFFLKHLPRDCFLEHLLGFRVSTQFAAPVPTVPIVTHGTRSLWHPPYGIGAHVPSVSL